MGKKKSSGGSGGTSYNSALVQIQRLANQSAEKIQGMVNSSNKLQMEFNKEEAQKARDWQTTMSKTAHQMEVEDLKKAGLNPVLSSGGSGAQSYTTSSASTQNDSGASASAAILEGQLGAMTNLESTRMSTYAQMKAARAQAAATKAAAAANSAAIKYAANVDYAKAKYSADMHYKTQTETAKINTRASKWISQNKQASTPWGLFDKYATKLLKNTPKNINVSGFLKSGKTLSSKFKSDPAKYIKNYANANGQNVKLTDAGKKYANSVLKNMGIQQTGSNRRLVVNAYFAGNQTAYRQLLGRIPTTRYTTITRPGYR